MQDLALLRMLQLFDSGFPIGSFAHSSGLETYAQAGMDKQGLFELLEGQLEAGFGRLDAAAWALAYEANDLASLEAPCVTLSAWKPVSGVRRTSLKLGERLLTSAKRLYPVETDFTPSEPHHAVVIGALGRRLGVAPRPLVLAFLYSSLTAGLTAATRAMSLSPETA